VHSDLCRTGITKEAGWLFICADAVQPPWRRTTGVSLRRLKSIVVRIFVTNLTLWLLAAWTVPLCCLSMSESPAHLHSDVTVTLDMPGHQHHHHHYVSESDRSPQGLSASDSCTQNCQRTSSIVVMSLPTKNDLRRTDRVAVVMTAPLPAISSSRVSLVSPALGPPETPPAPALHPVPLRV
jgi:hypothetical protein